MAAVVEDIVVGLEDPVGEPVIAQELPDVFDRVELGRAARQRQQRHVGGDRLIRCGPSILQENRPVISHPAFSFLARPSGC